MRGFTSGGYIELSLKHVKMLIIEKQLKKLLGAYITCGAPNTHRSMTLGKVGHKSFIE